LISYALRASLEIPRIALRPPVPQVPPAIVLAAFIIEAVRELVADGAAGVAIVGRSVHLGIVKRRQKNAGGKVDVIELRVVIGIDGRRRHVPLAAIHGPADFRGLAPRFKLHRASHIAEKIAALNGERGVIAPHLRITHLVAHCSEFGERLGFGGGRHPVQFADTLSHRSFDLLRHSQRLRFHGRGKGVRDEFLTQRFAQIAVHPAHTFLPARLIRLDTPHVRPIERKLLMRGIA